MKPSLINIALAAGMAGCVSADEGLWLFNQFPKAQVEKKYGFRVTDEFLRRLQSASVRFSNGGSGSFVSPSGLLFTNHHVGADCIYKVSSEENDYMKNGFYARTRPEEKACPDLEVNILLTIEDVTGKVNAGAGAVTEPAEANRLRRAAMSRLEKDCATATGNRCDVVTLYAGGAYHLYQYKKYTDVRLVFAPEEAVAAFGGDPDNFTYPRYCLDFALFRAYENGAPARIKDYLPWSKAGAREGELTFISGHPGRTDRMATVAALEFQRDLQNPQMLKLLRQLSDALLKFGARSEESKRIARDNLSSFQNSYKARTGFQGGLSDSNLMELKRQDEKKLRAAIAGDPARQKEFGAVWDQVAAAYSEYRGFYTRHAALEIRAGIGSQLFTIARDVLRYAEEKQKPNEDRLREYTDAALPSLEQQMYSTAPVYDALEAVMLREYFLYLERELGAGDPVVGEILGGRSAASAAEHYVNTSKIKDVAERKRVAGDVNTARATEDGMIRLARIIDPHARRYRKLFEDKVDAALKMSASKIAQARFAVYGAAEYPDATFTLRLTFAPVKGYRNAQGQPVAWRTTFDGLYQRATGVEPFRLPARWLESKSKLKRATPFNFVTTADTHGGNSGSPTVNTKGEIIGILFDGNLESLPNQYVYRDNVERSIHVASQGIVEAMRKLYDAGPLLKELGF